MEMQLRCVFPYLYDGLNVVNPAIKTRCAIAYFFCSSLEALYENFFFSFRAMPIVISNYGFLPKRSLACAPTLASWRMMFARALERMEKANPVHVLV